MEEGRTAVGGSAAPLSSADAYGVATMLLPYLGVAEDGACRQVCRAFRGALSAPTERLFCEFDAEQARVAEAARGRWWACGGGGALACRRVCPSNALLKRYFWRRAFGAPAAAVADIDAAMRASTAWARDMWTGEFREPGAARRWGALLSDGRGGWVAGCALDPWAVLVRWLADLGLRCVGLELHCFVYALLRHGGRPECARPMFVMANLDQVSGVAAVWRECYEFQVEQAFAKRLYHLELMPHPYYGVLSPEHPVRVVEFRRVRAEPSVLYTTYASCSRDGHVRTPVDIDTTWECVDG